ncbi:hypothetical protein B0T21DRAFT_146646 [Apiosordaria backusii]|uniref:Uncharacterized protein n=1 Tax=Apiosordaria backusii TaxID=314023 RepID=A0AA40EGZ0_9PEZI|nr:hypothetical protein B0T21DRAFT_146646 [Apiosordaria backusii]
MSSHLPVRRWSTTGQRHQVALTLSKRPVKPVTYNRCGEGQAPHRPTSRHMVIGRRRIADHRRRRHAARRSAKMVSRSRNEFMIPLSPISISRTCRRNQYFASPYYDTTAGTPKVVGANRGTIEVGDTPQKQLTLIAAFNRHCEARGACSCRTSTEESLFPMQSVAHARIAGTLRGNEKPGMSSDQNVHPCKSLYFGPPGGRPQYPRTMEERRRWVVMLTPWPEFKQRPAR